MRHVIGFGNPLHGDDGVASFICNSLSRMSLPADVRVFDAGTRGLDALALLTDCREAILIDAAMPQGQPGRIATALPGEVRMEEGFSLHAGGVGALLRAMKALDANPPCVRLVTVEADRPRPFEMCLSPAVRASADRLVAQLREYLEA